MSYLDESPYDDRDRDRGGRDRDERDGSDPAPDARRRPSRPTRPAWDAGTYGTRDELRRPAPGGGGDYPPPPDSYRPDAYQAAPRWEPPRREPPPGREPPGRDPTSWDAPASWDAPVSWDAPARHEAPARYQTPVSFGPPPTSFGPPASFASPEPDEFGSASFGPLPYGDPWNGRDPAEQSPERYPGGRDDGADDGEDGGGRRPGRGSRSEPGGSRAGRNLPAAIGVGLGLGAIAAASLFFWRPAFLAVIAVVVGIGIWELVRAIRINGANPPLIPLVAGGALMMGLAWWGRADALTFGLIVTVLAAMVWRLADGAPGYGEDVISATLVAVYVPFLAGFAAMLASAPNGDLRVVVTLAGVVLSDTGGYVAGVLIGRHPMAPSVSPKKSWEGLIGSLAAAGVGGALLLHYVFHVHWYYGLVFGLAVSIASVVGDLGESMIKRDLGVKDMSNLLPGHGGFMDRLDSILFAAPTAYALLAVLTPTG